MAEPKRVWEIIRDLEEIEDMKYHEQQAILGLANSLFMDRGFPAIDDGQATAYHNSVLSELISYVESIEVDWEDS